MTCRHAGECERARELFERLLCNDVGLLVEEIDPHSGELIGNVPQAFSHVVLIQSRSRSTCRASR